MASSVEQEQTFVGPGLSLFKRIVTILGLIGVTALVLWIAVYQHAQRGDVSVIGSTIAAVLFIAGFIYYLSLVAPVPFTISVGEQGVTKKSRRGEEIALPWDQITKIREEFFPNGKRIGVIVYRQIIEPGQKAKAWAVYRDDVPNLDELAEALAAVRPQECSWERETVHE